MVINEIQAKSVLTKSLVYDYTINPYVGCTHSCAYCYAKFMKRFTHHKEPWGSFVDVKINSAEVLAKEIAKKKPGRGWISGVTDPYQPLDGKYQLTRKCLELLLPKGWHVIIQTKSPLVVLRDLEILTKFKEQVEVGFSIATADESMRQLFEPGAPPIKDRINALGILHSTGIKTFSMIGPILLGAAGLISALSGKVDYVMVDKLNYHNADWLYRENGIEWAKEKSFFIKEGDALKIGLEAAGIPVNVLF